MELEHIERLKRDIKEASIHMTPDEARFLVDAYYMMQEDRKRAHNQERSLSESQEPNLVIQWLAEQSRLLENQIKRALDAYSASQPIGVWSREITGIGPVIAAGLMAHIDITRAPTVGHIWRYAGLDPTSKWSKGEKRPWNAELKTLCWKIGESFVKVSGREDAFYGQVYLQRKEQEVRRNEALEFADQASKKLEDFKIGKDTDAYKAYIQGKLPPAHIHARAKRYAVKLFLSHWHEVAYVDRYGQQPPLPYPIAHQAHAHKIPAPEYQGVAGQH